MGIFSYKFAPIQISYLGYPGTLGAKFIDYMIADKVVLPDDYRKFYSENIIYLPNSYQVNDDDKVISNKGVKEKTLVLVKMILSFVRLISHIKLLPIEFNSWMKILKSVPNSVLWLMDYFDLSKANLKNYAESWY